MGILPYYPSFATCKKGNVRLKHTREKKQAPRGLIVNVLHSCLCFASGTWNSLSEEWHRLYQHMELCLQQWHMGEGWCKPGLSIFYIPCNFSVYADISKTVCSLFAWYVTYNFWFWVMLNTTETFWAIAKLDITLDMAIIFSRRPKGSFLQCVPQLQSTMNYWETCYKVIVSELLSPQVRLCSNWLHRPLRIPLWLALPCH